MIKVAKICLILLIIGTLGHKLSICGYFEAINSKIFAFVWSKYLLYKFSAPNLAYNRIFGRIYTYADRVLQGQRTSPAANFRIFHHWGVNIIWFMNLLSLNYVHYGSIESLFSPESSGIKKSKIVNQIYSPNLEAFQAKLCENKM